MAKRFGNAWLLTNLTFRKRSNRIYYNYNSDLIIDSRWQTHTIFDRRYLNEFRHAQTQMCVWIYTEKVAVKIDTKYVCISVGEGLRLKELGTTTGPVFSFLSLFQIPKPVNWWPPRDPAQNTGAATAPRGAQRASLGTVVQRVASCFAVVISQFPSWPQSRSVIFLKISVTIILFHLGYDSGKLNSKAFKVISCPLPWSGNRISCYGSG